jgi:GNAT superfamily N-acetyltransferase
MNRLVKAARANKRANWNISFDSASFDLDRVYGWLADESYWAAGRPREVFDRAVRNSLCVGAFTAHGRQVGFGRLVTDYATFAWLSDIFVDQKWRGQGVSAAMLDALMERADLATIKRFMLTTNDAHGLYERYGFGPVDSVRLMQRMNRGAPTPSGTGGAVQARPGHHRALQGAGRRPYSRS